MRTAECERALEGYDRLEMLSSGSGDEITLEQLSANFRLVNYSGGEYGQILQDGIKLSTIRKPEAKYLEIEPGEVVVGYSVDEQVPVAMVHIGTISGPLWMMPPELLALDGFWSLQETEAGMQKHYPDVTLDSEMLCLIEVPLDMFMNLGKRQQARLFSLQPKELVKDRMLRPVFWRALAWRYLDRLYSGFNGELPNDKITFDWLWQLCNLGLISERQRIAIENYRANPTREYAVVEVDSLGQFERLLRGNGDGGHGVYYQKIILGLPAPKNVADDEIELPPRWDRG